MLVPMTRGILRRSPELCGSGKEGAWDFAQRVKIGIVDEFGDKGDEKQKKSFVPTEFQQDIVGPRWRQVYGSRVLR